MSGLRHFSDLDEMVTYVYDELVAELESDLWNMEGPKSHAYTHEERATMRNKIADIKRHSDLILNAPRLQEALGGVIGGMVDGRIGGAEASEAIEAHAASLPEPEVYEYGEDPMTCPKCGTRTEFDELNGDRQEHHCPNCKFTFIAEPAEE